MIRENTNGRCNTKTSTLWMSIAIFALISNIAAAETPTVRSFPGAEGYGAMTIGGRGGKVIAVTNLDESGPGSLRAAFETKGPRIVVFKVSGTIDADLKISNDHITVAGQTAPGDGITIRGQLRINANEVIVRYIRVRSEGRDDAVSGRYKKNIILDHVSASWSKDEVMSIYHGENVTIQWCMATEACGGSHRFGGIWGNNHGTYHHNLIAHNVSRNPRFASGSGHNDFRNNVIYNWQHQSAYGGEAQQPIKATSAHKLNETFSHFSVNMVANYYKPGPATDPNRKAELAEPSSRGDNDKGKWYVAGNFIEGSPSVTGDNWTGVRGSNFIKLDRPWEAIPIDEQPAQEAYESVFTNTGVILPKRDVVDARIIAEIRNGTATYEGVYKTKRRVADESKITGIIDSQNDVSGWPELKSTPAPTDTDHDGMPDEWERKHDLDPSNAGDGSEDKDGDGFTNLEEYLNGLLLT